MELLREPPSARSYEQLLNHYRVEKSLADQLRRASREERKAIYSRMYDELFARVPDHPNLTETADPRAVQRRNQVKLQLVRKWLAPSSAFVEFGPGDCSFAIEVAPHVASVRGVDIADHCAHEGPRPPNFELIIYDGYRLDQIEKGSVDVVFSDQFVEHLHPEDTRLHFELALSLLKPGGHYIFNTPHAYNGPHDISWFFSREPEGFHLKEWSCTELRSLLRGLGYSRVQPLWWARGLQMRLPYAYFAGSEQVLARMPWKLKTALARLMLPTVCVVVTK